MLPKPARCVILETMSRSSKRCLEVKTMVPRVGFEPPTRGFSVRPKIDFVQFFSSMSRIYRVDWSRSSMIRRPQTTIAFTAPSRVADRPGPQNRWSSCVTTMVLNNAIMRPATVRGLGVRPDDAAAIVKLVRHCPGSFMPRAHARPHQVPWRHRHAGTSGHNDHMSL